MHQPDIRKVALFIAVLSGFITPFDLSAVTIALPSIGSEFAMDAVTLSWVSTAYLLAAGVFLVPFGRIADIYGRKKVFVAGLLLFIIASACMVLSVSSVMIILLRVLQGTGAALIFGTAVAILTEVSPVAERGRALGIYTTAVYLGLSLGPFLGGFLVQHFGWRSLFLVNVPIGLFTIALILLYLKGEWADSRGETFDLGGAVQYGLALICIMYGFSLLPDTGRFSPPRGGYRDTSMVCGTGIAGLPPPDGYRPLDEEPGLRLLQSCRTHQLQCDLCRDVLPEPLPPVCQGY